MARLAGFVALTAIVAVAVGVCGKDEATGGDRNVFEVDCPPGTEQQGGDGFVQSSRSCKRPDGTRHGPYRQWFKDGTLAVDGRFEDGREVGTWRYFDRSGTQVNEAVYRDGELVSLAREAEPERVPPLASDEPTCTELTDHLMRIFEVTFRAAGADPMQREPKEALRKARADFRASCDRLPLEAKRCLGQATTWPEMRACGGKGR